MSAQATNRVEHVLGRAAFALVLVYVVSAVVLNGIELGPVTPRAELVALLLVAMLWRRPRFADVVPPSMRTPVLWLGGSFAVFSAWSMTARFTHGDPADDVLRRLFSDHLAAFAGFVVIVVWITTSERLRWLLVTMTAVLVADALFVALQELGVDAAWDAWGHLFPVENETIRRGFDLAPGLVHGAFNHAFLVAAIVPLAAVLASADLRVPRMLAGVGATIGLVLLVRERTGAVVLLVLTLVWVVLAVSFFAGGLRALPGVRALLVIVASGAVLLVVATTIVSEPSRFEIDMSITRLVRFDDTDRPDLLADVWPALVDAPLIGQPETAIGERSHHKLAPTSTFVNVAVFEGIPGLVLLLVVNGALLLLVLRATAVLGRSERDRSERRFMGRLALACSTAVIAHLVASQLHNRGIWAGDYLPFWLAAIAVVAVREGVQDPLT